MTNRFRTELPRRPPAVALAIALASFAVTALIVTAVATGLASPEPAMLARPALSQESVVASSGARSPIPVTIHPSSVHVVGIVVERTVAERPQGAKG
ncbi:MAG: hypothetical protein U1F51_13660 [Burkholderiales bacterium]